MTHSNLQRQPSALPQMPSRFISSPCLFTLLPCLPLPALSSHIHLGSVPVPWHAAGICVLHKLLVWLHLATSSVLYFFWNNYKLRWFPPLVPCHRHSSQIKKRQNEAVWIISKAKQTSLRHKSEWKTIATQLGKSVQSSGDRLWSALLPTGCFGAVGFERCCVWAWCFSTETHKNTKAAGRKRVSKKDGLKQNEYERTESRELKKVCKKKIGVKLYVIRKQQPQGFKLEDAGDILDGETN